MIYWFASTIIVYCGKFVPDFNTGSLLFETIYFRGEVKTTWFPLA